MPSPRPDSFARRLLGGARWLAPIAGLALVPKCAFCLLAYAGLGTLFGFRLVSPELCGGAASSSPWPWLLGLAAFLGLSAQAATTVLKHRAPQ